MRAEQKGFLHFITDGLLDESWLVGLGNRYHNGTLMVSVFSSRILCWIISRVKEMEVSGDCGEMRNMVPVLARVGSVTSGQLPPSVCSLLPPARRGTTLSARSEKTISFESCSDLSKSGPWDVLCRQTGDGPSTVVR